MTGVGAPPWASRLLYGLVAVVGVAAAVTSLVALHGLAVLSGWSWSLAWLLPVTVDAGAAAGAVAWLATPGPARRFGRGLALALLAVSVAGNGAGHLLAAAPPWWLVVAVSAVPPVVLGAMVHLALLAAPGPQQQPAAHHDDQETPEPTADVDDVDARPVAALATARSGSPATPTPARSGTSGPGRRARDPAPAGARPAA